MKFLLALAILLSGNLAHAETPLHIRVRALENAKSVTKSIWKVKLTPTSSMGDCKNKAQVRTLYFTPRVTEPLTLAYSVPMFDFEVQGDAGIDKLFAQFNTLIDPSGDGLFVINLLQNKSPEDLTRYLPENTSVTFNLKYRGNKLSGEATYRGHNSLYDEGTDYCYFRFKVTGEPIVNESCNE